MISFDAHPDCKLCSLHETAQNPGLPTRVWALDYNKKEKAILFVGQSPGYQEDKKGKSFVGYTGQLLDKMIRTSRLGNYAHIYFANACRCKPPQGADESQSNIRACRPHLVEDVEKLQAIYDEVIVVALGAKACYSVLHVSSLNETLKKQGKYSDILGDDKPRVFATFHPAMLHPMRKPGLIRAVETHFSLLVRYLKGEFIPNELKIEPELFAEVPKQLPGMVAVDIETYGILSGVEQTVFHPIKSEVIDGIPPHQQIVTVAFGWEEENKIRTAIYIYNYKGHRKRIREWFRQMSLQKSVCLGQNLKFDLLYLASAGDQEIPYWIDPRRLVVDDTLLWSFLLYEQQPEKGLKELSTLFGITDYSGLRVTGKSGTAKSFRDKDLHYYNCLDVAATICLRRELERRIRERYGDNSPKLSDTCAWMRNIAVWDTFDLEKNGSALNLDKLMAFHNQEKSRCQELLTSAEAEHRIKLAGTGSDKPLRQLMLDCLAEANLMDDSRVEWSKKTKKISIGVENVNLIKEHISPGSSNAQVISDFQEYKERAKIINTYTTPLLENPRRGVVTSSGRTGIVFPSWYPVPAYFERGGSSDSKSGGQIQGRFSCKGPARQTEPKSIRNCSCSRWEGGTLIEVDMSQDHLRMAALLSGDPVLMEAYEVEGQSIHVRTACTIFPDLDPETIKKTNPDEYKLGKTLNFLVIFRGGAAAYQRTALQDCGIEVELEFCDQAIKSWARKHHVYWEWQNKMIDLAARQGYLVLPTGWSRTFGLGIQNIAGQTGEVLNFLHQTPCAQLTHSAHFKTKREFLDRNLRSMICLNIYDALFADIYPGEEKIVTEILMRNMNNPPLLSIFERWVGRKINWVAELKEYK